MKVRFRTNLGSRDAAQFELDHTKCTAGAEVSVSNKVGEELDRRGIAEITEQPKVKAVAPAPQLKAVTDKPEDSTKSK